MRAAQSALRLTAKSSVSGMWCAMIRTVKEAMRVACVLAVLVSGCKEQSSYEVAHLFSPDGSLEASVTETNGGATTSFGYEVSVGVKGSKTLTHVASLYGA